MLPEVFHAWLHMQWANRMSPDRNSVNVVLSLSELPLLMPHSEIVQEQHSDSLKEILEHVLPTSEISSAENGYFLHNEWLFGKWALMS